MRYHMLTIEFTRLRAIFGATDGNLVAHLTTLEGAGFEKDAAARKPRTRGSITRGYGEKWLLRVEPLNRGRPMTASAPSCR
jgi:hypothetical protein